MFPTTLLPPATEIHFRFVSSFIQEFTPHKQIHCQIRKRKTSNTADKPGHRQGVRRLGGQVWVQRGIPTTLQLEWGPGACTFHSSSMGFSEAEAYSFPGHCPGPERKQRPREACGFRASTARPGRWDRLLLLGAHAPGGVGVCVGGYALENLTSHSLLTPARGSNVCGGRGGPSRLSSDQLCLCKTQKKPRACSTTCFRFTLYRTYSIYILQET